MGSSMAEQMVGLSFMKWLHEQETDVRLQNYAIYDQYYYGEQTSLLPANIKKAYDNPTSIVANYCRKVVDKSVRYICGNPANISLDVTEGNQKNALSLWAEDQLTRLYRRWGLMDTELIKFIRLMCKKGDSFLKLSLVGDKDPDIKITVTRPDVVFPKYRDDDYEEMASCAVKWYEIKESGERSWFAQVFFPDTMDEEGNYVPGRVDYYHLGDHAVSDTESYTEDEDGNIIRTRRMPTHIDQEGDQPEFLYSEDNPFGVIPVFHARNSIDDVPFGESDLADMIQLQDFMNLTLTDLSLVMQEQAFQRLFLFGAQSNEEFSLAPGVINVVPNESGGLQSIPPVNIGNYLYAIDTIVSLIADVSDTPKQAFAEHAQGLPASGYALKVRYIPLEDKCNEKKAQLQQVLRRMNQAILSMMVQLKWLDRLDGVSKALIGEGAEERLPFLDVKVHFPGGLPKDDVMEVQKEGYKVSAGFSSRRSAMERLGEDNPDEEMLQILREQGIDDAVIAVLQEKGLLSSEPEGSEEK